MFTVDGHRLKRQYDAETLWIEPWGENSLRIRASCMDQMPCVDWALLPPAGGAAEITVTEQDAVIHNGNITARVDRSGKIRFYHRDGRLLLEEMVRDMDQRDFSSHMRIRAREHKGVIGGDYQVFQRFESDPDEKLFGMGQYQQGVLNLKGACLELAHRNSQISVPFVLSDRGYGLLWHNPSMGSVSFGTNHTQWHAVSTKLIDYWITADDTPSAIVETYVRATGLPPMMPDSAMGFWQCKLRYRSQRELLEVAREYKRRHLPIAFIVIDFYHWTKHGEWKFDPVQWPDPSGMVKELHDMGIEVAVSIWPTIQQNSENYYEMLEKGYLSRVDMGARVSILSSEWTVYFDATNADARRYVWEKVKKNYYDAGIRFFWLDAAEPQYNFGFEPYRYKLGSQLQVGNIYPLKYAQGFYDGLTAQGEQDVLSLARCAWVGSQRYGTLVWSGDIHSSFKSMRWQLYAGLNIGIAGISWWTTDIGGFDFGDIREEGFRELLVRWFQWGAFCPVMRLHGDRQPHKLDTESGLTDYSGADNEVWSFGDQNYPILEKYLVLRNNMLPYIRRLMLESHQTGRPVMRPLFYHYPNDPKAWEIKDSYLFGADVLVAPVMESGIEQLRVYLPEGDTWIEHASGKRWEGGRWVMAEAHIDVIPVFLREGAVVEGLSDTVGTNHDAPAR